MGVGSGLSLGAGYAGLLDEDLFDRTTATIITTIRSRRIALAKMIISFFLLFHRFFIFCLHDGVSPSLE